MTKPLSQPKADLRKRTWSQEFERRKEEAGMPFILSLLISTAATGIV